MILYYSQKAFDYGFPITIAKINGKRIEFTGKGPDYCEDDKVVVGEYNEGDKIEYISFEGKIYSEIVCLL